MPRILLVDDSAMDRHLFTEILEKEADFVVESSEDGEAALEAMSVNLPDIVLTDMQMPNMDGLELVTQIGKRYPHIPVVLITGRGSESLATQALRAGAAGYVPKSHGNDWLTESVRHVMQLGKRRDPDDRVSQATTLLRQELVLENDPTLIPGVLEVAREHLERVCVSDAAARMQVEVALEHALQNAIYHGNLDCKSTMAADLDQEAKLREADRLSSESPYCDRRVHVAMDITPTEARFVVRDEGEGFDMKEVSSLGLTKSLRGEFGRGMFLMWAFMDKVVFSKDGNMVTLRKRFATLPKVEPNAESEATLATVPEPVEEVEKEVYAKLCPIDGGASRSLTAKRVTVGRSKSCDLVIDSTSISDHHCLFFVHEGWWFVRDLNSTNGVKVNGKQFRQHLVPINAVVSIGPLEFRVDYDPYQLGAVGLTPPVDPD